MCISVDVIVARVAEVLMTDEQLDDYVVATTASFESSTDVSTQDCWPLPEP